MKKYLLSIVTLCLLITNLLLSQQAGDLDITFGDSGIAYFPDESKIKDVKIQPDGKILALGASTLYRLDVSGTTDASFGNNGAVSIGCTAVEVEIMPDGEHIVVTTPTCDTNNLKVYDASGNLVNEITISGCGTSLTAISPSRVRVLDCVENIREQNIFDDSDFFEFNDGLPVTGEFRPIKMAYGTDYMATFGASPYIGNDSIRWHVAKILDSNFTAEWVHSEAFSGTDEELNPLGINVGDVLIQPDGKILYRYGYDPHQYAIRLNPDGSLDNTFNTIFFEWGYVADEVPKGMALNSDDEIVVSFHYPFAGFASLALYNKDGSYSSEYVGFVFDNFTHGDIATYADNSVLLAGSYPHSTLVEGVVIKFTSNNDYSNFIEGKVFKDDNNNCTYDDAESVLSDWFVKIEGDYTTYTRTQSDGTYNIGLLDTGTYNISLISPNYLWDSFCFEDTIIHVDTDTTSYIIDFGIQPTTLCPLLEVDVTAPFVRRCFDSNYYVSYCNSGTAVAENAYVEVQLDPFFTYQNSTITTVDLGDNLYSFDLGNIDIGECSNFRIDVYVDCDSTVLGQTHCVEAHIYPDSICSPVLPLWDESSIEVDGECLGDSIKFRLKNIGTGDMLDSLEYIVVEDDLIWQRANFQLNSGDELIWCKAANGSFYRLESEQSLGHPGNSMPSVFVEGCGTNDNGEISMGFVNYYLLDEGDAFVSIDCQENVGSYDPNDKQAFPVGYGAPHYITDNTDLEYMIRFQNTGTDTAFNIVIRDTISPHLNIEALRPGVASHDYRYDIEESNIAVFHFENIMLPDSNVNEAASHGFIKFNIEQQRDNSIGTHIMNNAAIYFDFNEPIITNTVFHTVGEDFMGAITSIITPPEVEEAGISVNVFPNPFDEYTRFEVQGKATNELHLNVYDIMGREVLQQKATHKQHITMKRNSLTPGVYVFRLMNKKQQLATGKLVIK